MMAALTSSCVVLVLCLGLLRSDGSWGYFVFERMALLTDPLSATTPLQSQKNNELNDLRATLGELLSESGTSQDKSCEQEGQVKGHDDSADQKEVVVSGAAKKKVFVNGAAQKKVFVSGAAQKKVFVSGAAQKKVFVSGAAQKKVFVSGAAQKKVFVSGADQNEVFVSGADQKDVFVSGADQKEVFVSNGQTRLWMGRHLMSDLREEDTGQDGREASSILKENLRQKWQTRVRQQRKAETLPEINQRRQHQLQPTDRIQTTEHATQPPTRREYSLGRQNGANRNRDPIRQETNTNNEPSKVETSVWNGSRHVSTEPFKITTIIVRKDSSQPRKEHTRRPHLRRILTSTIQPNLRGNHQDGTDTTMDVTIKRRNSQVTFVTQSSMIYPFIATTRAYNFLTSYDSWPLPTRWPIKMILPERDRSASQEMKSVPSNNEGKAVPSGQNGAPHPGCNQQSLQPGQPNKGDEDQLNIKPMSSSFLSDVHEGQEIRPTTDSHGRSCIEDERVNDPYIPQQTQTPNTLNEHTHNLHVNSDQATGNKRDKSGDEKNRKRKKRKNKLRKQRKRRKQKKREMEKTPTAPDQCDETYPLGPALADSDALSDPHSVAVKDEVVSLVTKFKYDRTTAGVFPVSGKQGMADTFLHSHGDNALSDSGNHHHFIYEERTKGTDNGRIHSHPNIATTQPPKQLLKTTAMKATLKSQTGGRSDKLSRFSDTFSNRKSDDNQMPTSRRYDSSTTPSLVLFNKHTLPSCQETDLPQKCAEDITNDSPDNTEQHMLQHLEDHTDSDLQRQRASPEDKQSAPQVIHNNIVKEKEDTDRRSFSPLPPTQASRRERVKRKTNVYNRVTSYPTTSTYTETTPLHLSPSNIHLSELSSARQWRERMKQRQSQSHRVPKENTPTINSDSSDSKPVKRKGSLGSASSMSKSQTTPPDSSNVDLDKKESGPFIGYKSAYDFLSNQKGINSHFQNEARREANEMNRYMAEGMCQIFGKRYVPTRIGGKCV